MKKFYKVNFVTKLIICILFINIAQYIILSFCYINNAEEVETNEIMEKQASSLDVSGFISRAQEYVENDESFEIDINNLFTNAIKGNIDNKGLISSVISLFFRQGLEALSSVRNNYGYSNNI